MEGRKLARQVWVRTIPGKGIVRAQVLKMDHGQQNPETAKSPGKLEMSD